MVKVITQYEANDGTVFASEYEALENEKIKKAIQIALNFGNVDGAQHKQYALDTIIRILAGDRYSEIIHDYEYMDSDEKLCEWNTGIAP